MFALNVGGKAAFAPKQVSRSLPAPLQVLIVEDDEADAYLIRRLLIDDARIGRVIRAVDGVEALEMLNVGVNPDLVFVDLQMPRMNGFVLVEELGQKKLGVPIIVLTSSTAPSEPTRRRLRAADKILSKPDSVYKMRRLLVNAIDGLDT